MNNICCLLDTCTIINLIHIDKDDFLLKKLDKVNFTLNSVVFDEVRKNVYLPLNKGNQQKYSDKSTIEEKRKSINQVLPIFQRKKNDNEQLLNDLGNDYFDKIISVTKYYNKLNGELCSSAYALYLSRINSEKIFFYTDDYPAKEHFSPFFDHQQIGQIKDSVDLLILLYWLDDNFTETQLDNTLSDLHSLYATEVTVLKQKLQDFYNNNVNAKFKRSKEEIVNNLSSLINKLDKLDFKNIGNSYSFFEAKKSKCKDIFEILKSYNSVFELEIKFGTKTLLDKISQTRASIKENKIYKWSDLLSN